MAAASVHGVVEALNAIFGLPVDATEAPAEVAAMIESVSSPDSEARRFLDDQLALALDPAIALRGDARGQAMGPAELADDGSFTVDGCLSLLTENASDDVPPEGIATSSGVYVTYPLEGKVTDGTVALTQVSDLDATDPPVECVPPDMAADVTAAWEQYIEAVVVYRRDTKDEAARAEVAKWVPEESVELNQFDESLELFGTQVGFQTVQASRNRVQGSYCQDPDRNPDAGIARADGSFEPLPRIVVQDLWELQDSQWREIASGSFTSEVKDQVPELWARCFDE